MKFLLTKAPMKSILVITKNHREAIIDDATNKKFFRETKVSIAFRLPSCEYLLEQANNFVESTKEQLQMLKVGLSFMCGFTKACVT